MAKRPYSIWSLYFFKFSCQLVSMLFVLGNIARFSSSADFSPINVFKTFFQEYDNSVKQFGSGSKLFVKVFSR